ncbi:hypothetical protein Metal_3819 [Methylomicrobium album BG8]|uniref:Uncharacterized protein n=1 Tax=Methylomicrobium album BG8 TaxID=686340 RepID=H8GIE9_METAL|nr:hypothetical protein Metal_3819 [Methylomicrobium album BG8]
MADCLSANPPYRGAAFGCQSCRLGTLFVPDTFDVMV